MSQFIIQGGVKLRGEVEASGMKNAAVAVLAAALLTEETCVFDRVPRINDVEKMVEILQSLGAAADWTGQHQLTVNCAKADLKRLDKKLVKSMRASILFLGSMLSRFKEVVLPEPGGCIIGNRPIDTHLFVLKKLGAEVSRENGFYHLKTAGLKGATIILPEFSVTATENGLMATVLAEGATVIKLAAAEPHVEDLANFLIKMGAKIEGAGTHLLKIEGVKKLKGARHELIPDQIEIGTLAVAAAVTRGEVKIAPVIPSHLDSILPLLGRIGVAWEIKGEALFLHPSGSLNSFKLQAMPYPGFPTDLQAPFGVLATQCFGTSLIHDPLYEGRLGYINELVKMGANAVICDPHRVLITGPTPLYGQEIKSFDLRAGATMIIAGLLAEGETVINDAEVVFRGYEAIDEKLRRLGAKIEFVK